MKISILLPLKENFSPVYAGAVSLFINDTLEYSKFKKNITVFGALFVEIDKILDKYYSYYTIRLHRRKVNLHSSFFSS